jgi:hypothetical protein
MFNARMNRLRRADLSRDENVEVSRGAESPDSPKSVAELEWPVIDRIIRPCASFGGTTILSWIAHGDTRSYEWLKRKAAERGVPFNDWYPRVASMAEAIPQYPLANAHSGGHYRGWVARQIAEGFEEEIERAAMPTERLSSMRISASR